mgnify:CR=1 FL=1
MTEHNITPHEAAQQVFADIANRLQKRGDCRTAYQRLCRTYDQFYIAMPVDADMTCTAARRRAFDYILLTLAKRPEYRPAHTIAKELRNRYILRGLCRDDRTARAEPAPGSIQMLDDSDDIRPHRSYNHIAANVKKAGRAMREATRRAAALMSVFAIMCALVYAGADAAAQQAAFNQATACAQQGKQINRHASEQGEVPPC